MRMTIKDAKYYFNEIESRIDMNDDPDDLIEEMIKEKGSIDAVKFTDGKTLLTYAIFMENLELFNYLIKKGADIASRDNRKCTPLHHAAKSNSTAMLKCLIKNGADVNAKDKDNCTPLFCALMCHNTDNVEILLNANADVDISDMEGCTSLHHVIAYYSDNVVQEKVIRSVFSKSKQFIGDEDCRNSILDYANVCEMLELVQTITDEMDSAIKIVKYYFLEIYRKIDKGEVSKDFIEEMMKIKIDNINITNFFPGKNFLFHTIDYVRPKTFCYLIKSGADIEIKDHDNHTPLHHAAKSDSTEMLKCVLENGANVNAKDEFNLTPLYFALFHRRTNNVEILLNADADVDIFDKCGQSSLHHVIRYYGNHEEKEKIIRSVFTKSKNLTKRNNYRNNLKNYAENYAIRDLVVQIIGEMRMEKIDKTILFL